jgi:hypothetical protein
MDLKGYEQISAALAEAKIDASVTPQPEEGVNETFVTIVTPEALAPAAVLNALHRAGLMKLSDAERIGAKYGPDLLPISAAPGSITLEDVGYNDVREAY